MLSVGKVVMFLTVLLQCLAKKYGSFSPKILGLSGRTTKKMTFFAAFGYKKIQPVTAWCCLLKSRFKKKGEEKTVNIRAEWLERQWSPYGSTIPNRIITNRKDTRTELTQILHGGLDNHCICGDPLNFFFSFLDKK